MAELIDFSELQKVLQDLANDIRDNYKEHLQYSDRYTEKGVPSGYSKRLIDSVETHVVVGEREWLITMTLNDYWKYVENDTQPHFPPVSKLLEWVQIKPVLPRPDRNGRIPSPQSLAFLIGRAISKYGTKGSHDLEKVKGGVIPFYKEKIAAALGHDMENYIRKIMAE